MPSTPERRRHHVVVGGAAALAFLVLLGFQAGDVVDAPAVAPVSSAAPEQAQPFVPPSAPPPRGFGQRRFRRGGPRGGGFGAPQLPQVPAPAPEVPAPAPELPAPAPPAEPEATTPGAPS